MKRKLCRWLLMIFLLPLATGFYCHRPLVYTPDIVLKEDGLPCISIPLNEVSFFNKEKQFDIIVTRIFQVGVGTLWEKEYYDIRNLDLPSKYHVQVGQCLRFEYHFQENITYSIMFVSTVRGNDESKSFTKKIWGRDFRIKKDTDGTVKLLLDLDARENK
ncbi:hypothetical protein BHC59_02365 [Snodgrassella alvi]|jgi:hypothetical protein|uniref:putative T6SS immunity periplasmic lipoprotein n=2 Tax=Snodgrassella alvi TaxID=1196083 RepID=UPI000CB32980|nr:hypothetical protein [Snodgrassella alvi]PIT57746.1 hypothetical protein BHC59_02365 [Snodgrassella alvi]